MSTNNGSLKHEEIARKAYEIYEKEGRPKGREKEHWNRAEAELKAAVKPVASTAPVPPPVIKPMPVSAVKPAATTGRKIRR
jgi:hypothetical protein